MRGEKRPFRTLLEGLLTHGTDEKDKSVRVERKSLKSRHQNDREKKGCDLSQGDLRNGKRH